jgi:hypothetical protein
MGGFGKNAGEIGGFEVVTSGVPNPIFDFDASETSKFVLNVSNQIVSYTDRGKTLTPIAVSQVITNQGDIVNAEVNFTSNNNVLRNTVIPTAQIFHREAWFVTRSNLTVFPSSTTAVHLLSQLQNSAGPQKRVSGVSNTSNLAPFSTIGGLYSIAIGGLAFNGGQSFAPMQNYKIVIAISDTNDQPNYTGPTCQFQLGGGIQISQRFWNGRLKKATFFQNLLSYNQRVKYYNELATRYGFPTI